MLKSSVWIKKEAETNRLIEPFVPTSCRHNVISYGLGPYGYDFRLDQTYKLIKNEISTIDPFQISNNQYETKNEEKIVIDPGRYILGKSLEFFRMPKKVLGLVWGKSTYARLGIIVNVTPIEPEWCGFITISIANVSSHKVVLYPFQGIAQIVFFESDQEPIYSYQDLAGKYQQQNDISLAKIQKK